jgi:RecA-family ATPase
MTRVYTLAHHFDKHCGRKRAHATRAEAQKEAQRMEAVEKANFNPYHCEVCGKWHIGHKRECKA